MKWRIATVLLKSRHLTPEDPTLMKEALLEATLVLEAMREPTKMMMKEGALGSRFEMVNSGRSAASGAWDAMIECAINGEPFENEI